MRLSSGEITVNTEIHSSTHDYVAVNNILIFKLLNVSLPMQQQQRKTRLQPFLQNKPGKSALLYF